MTNSDSLPMLSPSGDQLIATILKHDAKTTSYKIALLRALNDVVLLYPGVVQRGQSVAIPLARLGELWVAYYWPFTDVERPIYQGARAQRGGVVRNDVSFRPSLTLLRTQWQRTVQLPAQAADGFFLFTEMRTPRRRASYAPSLQQAYDRAIGAMVTALKMPIQHAGPENVFAPPTPLAQLPDSVLPLPGTRPQDTCLVVPAALWEAFHRLSLYVEALCLHEWSLFTESVTQDPGVEATRGPIYTLLTVRPDNRRPLSWERNQIDLLLLENVAFTCPWTQKQLTQPHHYDLDHLLPLAVYPINELWNLLPVDRAFNQQVKRDRLPSQQRLLVAQPLLQAAYTNYDHSTSLQKILHEDAALRFTGLTKTSFSADLAQQTVLFLQQVADARYGTRF